MRKAILDTSSAILLYKAGIFEVFERSYSLFISRGVFIELTQAGYEGAEYFSSMESKEAITIVSVDDLLTEGGDVSLRILGQGEKESILLFSSGFGEFLVLDDKKGAAYCRKSGIPYVNAVLIARLLHLNRALTRDEFQQAFDFLSRIGRYSEKILDYALNCHPVLLEQFMPS